MIRLSPQQRIIAWRLALQPFVSRPELVEALWGWGEDGGALCTKAIAYRVWQLRRKLPGITIKVRWSFGYEVEPADREKLLDILAREIAANVCLHPSKLLEAA